MIFALDGETQLLQRTVRDFAEAEVAPAAGELDRTKAFPYEIVAKMAALGWMGIPFPEAVGGAGGSSLQYAVAVEELARVRVLPASDPASGSVRPKAPRISPEHSWGSHSSFCSWVPNR